MRCTQPAISTQLRVSGQALDTRKRHAASDQAPACGAARQVVWPRLSPTWVGGSLSASNSKQTGSSGWKNRVFRGIAGERSGV